MQSVGISADFDGEQSLPIFSCPVTRDGITTLKRESTMLGYGIETRFFVTFIGELTPEQYILFCKLCQSEVEECNEFIVGEERPGLVFIDCTQLQKKHEFNPCSENGAGKEVEEEKLSIDVQNPTCETFGRIFPAEVIRFGLKEFPHDSTKKLRRSIKASLYKNRNQRNPFFKQDTIAKDWDLLNDLWEFAEAARGNFSGKQNQQGGTTEEVTKPMGVYIENIGALRRAVYEGVLLANDVEDVDKWELISRLKHKGAGWAEMARKVLESEWKKPGKSGGSSVQQQININKRADVIRRKVDALRKNIPEVGDQDDWL
jgi:hypothetical protein